MSSIRSCGSPEMGREPTTRVIHSMFFPILATIASHSRAL